MTHFEENSDQKMCVKECSHIFCYPCIWRWAETRHVCPLCNTTFTLLITNNKEVSPPPIKSKEIDARTDLECLDHNYFLEEAKRLLSIAENMQRNLFKIRYQNKSSQFGRLETNTWEQKNWVILEDIVATLRSYCTLFQSDQRIDPSEILRDLYQMQDRLKDISKNPTNVQVQQPNKIRYSAEDFDNLPNDSDEDTDDSFEIANVHGKKGRKVKRSPSIKKR